MTTWTNETLDRAERERIQLQYGDGKWPCASCGRLRVDTDLARWYLGRDYFQLCHGVDDVSPTCYERYQQGREAWNAERKAARG